MSMVFLEGPRQSGRPKVHDGLALAVRLRTSQTQLIDFRPSRDHNHISTPYVRLRSLEADENTAVRIDIKPSISNVLDFSPTNYVD
jgi:hypothetical protein